MRDMHKYFVYQKKEMKDERKRRKKIEKRKKG
jgi:hypothetical protein